MFPLTADQILVRDKARHLAQSVIGPRAAEIDRTEAYAWENVEALTEAGLMGMTVPNEYGGQGLNVFHVILAIEEIAKVCAFSARIVVEANMGAIGAILAYGTEKQVRKVAPLVLAGDKPAICITEPEAGSAATQMTTTAVKRGDAYVLNGHKYWITGGGISKTHLIFARVIEDGEFVGIGGFLAFLGDEGLRIGERIPTMGLRAMPETHVHFDDLVVHKDMALIPPGGFKTGFKKLMTAYNGQRTGAATVALGIAEGAYALAVDHVKQREQFGRPIAEFQGLQWTIADMATQIAAAQALIYKATMGVKEGFPDMTEAAQAKIMASETAVKVTNDALQLHGANGYSRDLPLERMVRDARMFTIGGGTAQVLRNQVAGAELGMKLPQTRDGYSQADEDPQSRPDIRRVA